MSDLFDRASKFFSELQTDICGALAELDGGATFSADAWQRPGGGGVARVLEGGAVFEKAGVNWSSVDGIAPPFAGADGQGHAPTGDQAAPPLGGADGPGHAPTVAPERADQMLGEGRGFRACGVSLVLHPRSPMVPTVHANFRCVTQGDALWFGGGLDLTPCYLFRDDAVHFHAALAAVCDRHRPIGDYDRFKARCDEYFFLPHRQETRGVGGVFFDYLGAKGEHAPEQIFALVADLGRSFLDAYVPIAQRRQTVPYGDLERAWQLRRRGRYVEFNLLYDRGTLFGLQTNGRVESILMSLPPLARWDYDVMATPGSPEAELLAHLRPNIDWLART